MNRKNNILKAIKKSCVDISHFPCFDLSPLSEDCNDSISSIDSELMDIILTHSLDNYYNDYIPQKRYFLKKIPHSEFMVYSSELLTSPILNLNEQISVKALVINKNILSYMDDIKSSKSTEPSMYLIHILDLSFYDSMEIKDETYLQTLKQMTKSRNKEKLLKAWDVFICLSSTYAPTSVLYYSILNFLLYEIKNSIDDDIFKRANYCLKHLIKTYKQIRKSIPSELEIQHLISMKPITIPVYFFDDNKLHITVEAYSTVNEVLVSVSNQVENLATLLPYLCLYQVISKQNTYDEQIIEQYELVIDYISYWEKEKLSTDIEGSKFYVRLVFSPFYINSLSEEETELDNDLITLLYLQSKRDVLTGKFNLSNEDVYYLAILQLLNDKIEERNLGYYLSGNIGKYLPEKHIKGLAENKDQVIDKLIKEFQDFIKDKEATIEDSSINYEIQYLRKLSVNCLFQCQQFNVMNMKERNTEFFLSFNSLTSDELILGIGNKEVVICDSDRLELMRINLTHIASWGVNKDSLVLVVQKIEHDIQKLYLRTNSTKHIHNLLYVFTSLLAGYGITESIIDAEANIKLLNIDKSKEKESFTIYTR